MTIMIGTTSRLLFYASLLCSLATATNVSTPSSMFLSFDGIQLGNSSVDLARIITETQADVHLRHEIGFMDGEDDLFCNCTGPFHCNVKLEVVNGSETLCHVRKSTGACLSRIVVYSDFRNASGMPIKEITYGCYDMADPDNPTKRKDLMCRVGQTHCCREPFCNGEVSKVYTPFKDYVPVHVIEDQRWNSIIIMIVVLVVMVVLCGILSLISMRHPHLLQKYVCQVIVSARNMIGRKRVSSTLGARRGEPISEEMVNILSEDTVAELPSARGSMMDSNHHSTLLHDLESTNSGSGSGMPQLATRTVSWQIEIIGKIGQGRYGDVNKGRWRGDTVAVKFFHSNEMESWKREVKMYETNMLRHNNILRYIGCDSKDNGSYMQYWLITEYQRNGSLYEYLEKNTVPVELALRMIRGISSGLAYLHAECRALVSRPPPQPQQPNEQQPKQQQSDPSNSQHSCDLIVAGKPPIAHRDLKSHNILLKDDLTCVLADLGLSVKLEKAVIDVPHPVDEDGKRVANRVGTVRYLSPELLGDEFDDCNLEAYKMSDMYAFGLVLWEIAQRTEMPEGEPSPTALLPYHDLVSRQPLIPEMKEIVLVQQIRPTIPEFWKENPAMREVARVMRESWSHNPMSRLTALNVRVTMDRALRNLNPAMPASSSSFFTPSTTPLQNYSVVVKNVSAIPAAGSRQEHGATVEGSV